MCEPITLAGIALSIAGTVVNSVAASQVAEARASAMEAERQRQKGYQDEAAALNQQSLKRYSSAEPDIAAASQKAGDTIKSTQDHTADANALSGSQMPTSSSDIVNTENAKQMAKSNAYTGQQAGALGNLRGFGDMLGEASRGQAQDAMKVAQIGGFEKGSSNALSYELEAANQAGNGMKTFGDILGGLGSVGTSYGIGSAAKAGKPLSLFG